jgi:serine protease Do
MKRIWRTGRGTLPAVATITAVALGAIALAEHPDSLHATSLGAHTMSLGLAAPATSNPGVAKLQDLSDAFATIAAQVKPSVVYITAKIEARPVAQHSRGRRGQAPDMSQIPPELRQFFDMPGMPGMPGGPEGQDGPDAPHGPGMASGSGFIVSPDGYILTNNHVVDGASDVRVRLLDRREFKAKVVGRDPNTDVAVLKIDANGLTAAPLGDSEASRVGEWVLAVGNPLGENLTFTVTQGIISAKGRALELPGQSKQTIQDFIQTDAAINPGNSGGPLVNVRGEVIGINSAIESPTGYNAGYGFAVPINLARSVMSQIIKSGHVERAALGIQVRDANGDDAAYVGLKNIRGVLVEDFGDATSPAQHAGIQPGDVIVAIDGKQVDRVAQLQELIAFRKPGDVVTVEVARKGGQHTTVRVPLQRVGETAARDGHASDNGSGDAPDGASMHALGASVAPVDGATARQLQLPSDAAQGVLVTGVQEGSIAESHLATPENGGPDIILSVEGKAVHTPDDLRAALSHAKTGDILTLRVYNAVNKSRRIERVKIGATE